MQVESALDEYLENMNDTSLLQSLQDQCDKFPPEGFIGFAEGQLSSDGEAQLFKTVFLKRRTTPQLWNCTKPVL